MKLTWHRRKGVFRRFGQQYRWEFAANKGKYVVRYVPESRLLEMKRSGEEIARRDDWSGHGDYHVYCGAKMVKGGFVDATSARDWAEEHHRLGGGRLAASTVDYHLAKHRPYLHPPTLPPGTDSARAYH